MQADEFRDIFETSKALVIDFTETWFKTHHSEKSVQSNTEYKLFHNNRRRCHNASVAIYVRSGIGTRVLFNTTGMQTGSLILESIYLLYKVLTSICEICKAPNAIEITDLEDIIGRSIY